MQRKSISCLKLASFSPRKTQGQCLGLSSLPLKTPPFSPPKSVRTRRAGLRLRYNQFYSPPGEGGKAFSNTFSQVKSKRCSHNLSKSLRSRVGLLLTIIFW